MRSVFCWRTSESPFPTWSRSCSPTRARTWSPGYWCPPCASGARKKPRQLSTPPCSGFRSLDLHDCCAIQCLLRIQRLVPTFCCFDLVCTRTFASESPVIFRTFYIWRRESCKDAIYGFFKLRQSTIRLDTVWSIFTAHRVSFRTTSSRRNLSFLFCVHWRLHVSLQGNAFISNQFWKSTQKSGMTHDAAVLQLPLLP